MKVSKFILWVVALMFIGLGVLNSWKTPAAEEQNGKPLDVKGLIFGHIGDTYNWHVTEAGTADLNINLPIILYSKTSGWHFFSFARIAEHGGSYEGFSIAPDGAPHEGKLVEKVGNEYVRPWDFSITKVTLALFFNALILLIVILSVARWYRRHPDGKTTPTGFVGFMEAFIMLINDDVIKSSMPANYRKFSPYLLTAFFFIFVSNFMGLVPFFPFGVTVTGNIAITMILALFTFAITNITGSKAYWKDIFWPDVPLWLKIPPIIPFVEFFSIFTKPFALMVRLFGNMIAGHMGMLVLTSLIFITVSISPALCGSMSVISVFFNIFMLLLEVLIAFLQAYIFTMLSATFIGMSQEGKKEAEIAK
jgi:F-type H+-transporting ATPase subunit a